jgi:hypothetical protein
MDLYLAAAYEAEQINKPGNEPTSADWLEVVKRTHRACQTELANLKVHRKEHGC